RWPRDWSSDVCSPIYLAVADDDLRRVGRELARDELVRLEDRQHLLDTRVALERQRREQLPLADRADHRRLAPGRHVGGAAGLLRSEERRVGKECRSRR